MSLLTSTLNSFDVYHALVAASVVHHAILVQVANPASISILHHHYVHRHVEMVEDSL
jgi:hypothetical protein